MIDCTVTVCLLKSVTALVAVHVHSSVSHHLDASGCIMGVTPYLSYSDFSFEMYVKFSGATPGRHKRLYSGCHPLPCSVYVPIYSWLRTPEHFHYCQGVMLEYGPS